MIKTFTRNHRVLSYFAAFATALLMFSAPAKAQQGTDFWFAPPDVTDLHNPPSFPLYLLVSSTGAASTVTVSQPANGSFTPIVVNIQANKSARINLTAFKNALETRPTNTIVNTGLRIQATTPVSAYYEVANTNNAEIFALKGPNGLGTQFYIPMHKHAPFYNNTFASPDQAIASFDIVASQNATVVTIYSPVAVDGHPALQQFSVTLNAGQTYSCGYTGANYEQPSTHPSGAVVLADKPIAVTIKDDSDHDPAGGCYDLTGDQIVPVNVVGEDYIAVKGSLDPTGDESAVIVATQNNTQIYLDGASTPVTTLFAGEYYRVDMDYLSAGPNNSVFIHATQPIYCTHITGFGCEVGMALLPPLNCAGSHQVNFVRSTTSSFYLTLLVRTAAVNNMTITGPGTATITPASFVTVPGTGGTWKAARIQYSLTDVPVDSTFRVSNVADVFALGIIQGGSTSGCSYGYFSEYVAPIAVTASIDQTICANTAATLNGNVSGGTTTGMWTSTGTGAFTPNNTTLNATYTPSAADAAAGNVTLTLTSTGACVPQTDQMVLTITPAPTVNAGPDQSVCRNNPNVNLAGSVTIATGGVWTGGAGTFTPNNTTLNAVYTPTAAELAAGSRVLTLTTTGNGICNPVSDNVLITFTNAPTVSAGVNQTKCGNNPNTTLAGSVVGATGGVWSGGGGTFAPNAATLNAVYTPTAAEISAGSVVLTLTSTGNGNCNSVSATMTITFTAPPTANANVDQTKCANNPGTLLAGSVTIATGGQWTGGLGVFSPNNNTLGATYTPSATEIANGSVSLTLTTTGNGSCSSVNDVMTIFFTPAPTAAAGVDQTVCANSPAVTLNGSVGVASGGLWSGGAGTFSPNNTTMNAVYTPTAAEISAGTVTLTLTTTGNGTCNPVNDQMVITISPAPIVNAGPDISACANNAATSLNGQVFNAGGGSWTGGGGTFNPNNTVLNAIYTPSAAEIAAGTTTLTLTSTGNGSCVPVTDQVIISYAPSPVSNAGSDQTLCANNAAVSLNGNVNFCAGGQWSGGLGLFNPSANALNATYTPTAGDIATGFVKLILTTTGNGSCNPTRDTMTVFFTPAPTANAGSTLNSCANNPAVTLNGSFTLATGGLWSGGAGTFNPNNTTMNAVYTPTAAEISAGTTTLTLTTTGNGNCLPVSDNVIVNIAPSPTVNAGTDQTVCVTNLNVALSGSVSGSTNTGQWSTLGNGTFSPNNTTLNASYQCSSTDSVNGFVDIILTSTNNGACSAVHDTMRISILPAGTASAGADVTVCANNSTAALTGVIGGGATSGTWSSTGTGIFVPNNTTLNASYVPSAFDIANGSAMLMLTANSCNPAVDSLQLTITPAPVVNAGPDQTICSSSLSATMSGSVSGGSSTGVWTTNGTGTFTPNNTTLNATYLPSTADANAQTVLLMLTSTNNGSCVPVTDTMVLHIYPTGNSNAGPDQIVCANNPNITLNGAITGGATSGQWTTSGSGIFLPNDTTLNATYQPSASDVASGTVNLILTATNSCNAAIDFMTVAFTPAPIVDAGNSQSVCGSNPSISLNGSVANATGGTWSGGNGTFSPNNNALSATYTPTQAELNSGSVTLILTSTGNGNCNAVSDTVTMFLSRPPVVFAGVDQQVCRSAAFTQMFGVVSNGSTTGMWSTLGSGVFIPNDSALNALYQFSPADTAAGSVTIILTSTNNGNCSATTDTMTITFGPSAFAWAGNDQQVCSGSPSAVLGGFVTGGSTTGQWMTSGSGSFSPNDSTLSATYSFSSSDLAAGNVDLVLMTTNNGSCLTGYDTVHLSVTPISVVNAGGNQTICGDNLSVTLNGTVGGASGTGQWTTNGSGNFVPNDTTLNATYVPSTSDSLNGSVTLVLASTQTGVCASASDTIVIVIQSPAVVSAGPDQNVCGENAVLQLTGNVSGGSTTGQWSSSGTGTFSPNNTTLNATYTPSAADVAAGTVTLTLSSTGTGVCSARVDSLVATLQPGSTVSAGNDFVICGNDNSVQLAGLIGGFSSTGIWTTGGTGTFTPNATTLTAMYTLSASDVNNAGVTLVLTSTNNGLCPAKTDTVNVTVVQTPTAAFTFTSGAPTNPLDITFTDQSINASAWLWDFGNSGGNSTQQNPIFSYNNTGTYIVTLIVSSGGGCADTATATVVIDSLNVKPVDVPSGFTPNNDGTNDEVHVLGGPFKKVDFRIYNDWGNVIFSTNDATIGWDGTYKGKPQPDGVYVYTVDGETTDGKLLHFSGSITLIR